MRPLVLSLVILLPRLALATCEASYAPSAVRAQITQESIDTALRAADTILPDTVALPEIDRTVFECGGWFDDVAIHASGAEVRASLDQVEVDLQAGAIALRVAGSVNVSAFLELTVCALPNTACNVALDIDHFEVSARASIGVDDCVPEIVVDSVVLSMENQAVTLDLATCGLYGSILSAVHDSVRDALVDYVRTDLVAGLPELLNKRIADATTGLVDREVSAARLQFKAQPRLITVAEDALLLDFDLDVQPATRSTCVDASTLEPRPRPTGAPIALPQGQTAIGVSDHFVQRVMDSAWEAGWLCFDTRTTDVGIGDILDGTLPGSRIDALVVAKHPPRFVTGDDGGGVALQVEDLHGEVAIRMPSNEQYSATFDTGVFVGADVAVRDSKRRIVVAPKSLGMDALSVQIGRADLNLSRSTMAGFVEAAIMPRFLSSLREVPVTANVFTSTPLAIAIDEVRTSAAGIVASFSLFSAGPDGSPPRTALAEEPHCPCGAEVELTADSDDDKTPAGFIHHLIDIDGVAQTDVHVGNSISLSGLTGGRHEVKIYAQDLSGNIDASPEVITLDIDTTPPVVVVRDGPRGIIPAGGTPLRIDADDNMSKPEDITIDYVVEAVGRRAKDDHQLASGRLKSTDVLKLDGLPDLSTVRVRLTATDQAGNVATFTQSYAVVDDPGMGCAAAGEASLFAMLAIAGMLLRKRKRPTC
ncbi:MAG: hypothetical protein ACAI38_16715 [Myxococcota bacterium]